MTSERSPLRRAGHAVIAAAPTAAHVRRVVVALIAAMLLWPVPAAVPARAAGSATGLYIDGMPDDPLTQGLQQLYEAPGAILAQTTLSPDHTTVALALDIDGWSLVFKARQGETLGPGSYHAFREPTEVYGGLRLERTGHVCDFWAANFTITELEWAADGALAAFAADFDHACYPHEPLFGSVRFTASSQIVAAGTNTLDLDLGQTDLGEPGPSSTITVSNLGHMPVTFGPASTAGGNPEVEVVSNTCDDAPLGAGASCEVLVRLSGAMVSLNAFTFIEIQDDTPRGVRRVRVSGEVWTDTTTTISFDPARAFWPTGTFVQATVTPAPALSGTVTFTYLDDQGDPIKLTGWMSSWDGTAGVLADVPRGDHEWTAHFEGVNGWRPSSSAPAIEHTGLATVTLLTATVNPISSGEAGEFRAAVTTVGGGAIPAGTVTIRDGNGTAVGSGPVGGDDGLVVVEVPGLSLGGHDFTATYASAEDGSPSSAAYRLFVRTQGIAEAWTGIIPMASGDLQLGTIATDGDGVFVAGTTGGTAVGEASAGYIDTVVARFDTGGSLAWVTQLGTEFADRAGDVAVTPQGVFVSGASYGRFESSGTWPEEHPFLARLSLAGDVVWIRQDPMPGNAWQVAAAPDGGVYVAGTSDPLTSWGIDTAKVRRYRVDGTVVWESFVPSCCLSNQPEGVTLVDSLSSDEGGLLVAGYARGSVIAGVSHDDERGWVRRYSPAGAVLWTREIDGPYGAVTATQAAAGETGILVSGTSQAPIAGQPNAFPAENVWARRYTFDGSTVWTRPFAPDRLTGDCASFVTLGTTTAVPSGWQGGTLARIGLDGTDQWRYESPGSTTASTLFYEVAVAAGRAYLVEERDRGDGTLTRVLALTGIPAPSDCDGKAPSTTTPLPTFVTGLALGATAAVRLSWVGIDGQSGVARNELRRQVDGGPWVLVSDGLPSGTATQWMAPGHRYRFADRVVDRGGNAASATGPTLYVGRVDDRSASIAYRGGWRSRSSTSASSGTLRYATAAGATASFRFTGRSVAWVTPLGPTLGQARIYVDGTFVGSVNLWRSKSSARSVVWARSWTSAGSHTLTIRVSGTRGHPRVYVDAFLVLS